MTSDGLNNEAMLAFQRSVETVHVSMNGGEVDENKREGGD